MQNIAWGLFSYWWFVRSEKEWSLSIKGTTNHDKGISVGKEMLKGDSKDRKKSRI